MVCTATIIAGLTAENEQLRARLAELESQKPVGYFCRHPVFGFYEEQIGPSDSNIALYAQPAPTPAQVSDEWRSVMQDSAAIFRHYEALHKAKGGIADDKAERNRLAAERIEALLQPQPAEPVINKQAPNLYAQQQYSIIQKWSGQHNFVAGNDDFWRLAVMLADAAGVDRVYPKPSLPPGRQVIREPDVDFEPRDQIYISKIGVDGKAERGGTACRLDDSSLFWHFFNDWLLTQEGTD